METKTGPAEGTHLLDYVRVLLKRLWLIVGIFAVVVGVVGFATWKATRLYRATATIRIRQPSMVLGKLDPTELIQSVSNSQVYMNTQYALLGARSTVQQMVEKKGLDKWKEFQGKSVQEIARSIVGHVSVEPQRDTTLVRVSVVDPRQKIVHRIANALVETFADMEAKEAKSSLEDTISTLEAHSLEYSNKIEMIDSSIQRLMEQNNTDQSTFLERFDYLGKRMQSQQDLIDQLTQSMAEKKPLYDEIAAALKEKGKKGDPNTGIARLYGTSLVMRDEQVQEMENEILPLQGKLAALENRGLGPDKPEVQSIRRQIEDRETVRDKRKQMLLLGYYEDYESLSKTLDIDKKGLQESEDKYRSLAATKRSYDQFETKRKSYEKEMARYNSLWEKLEAGRQEDFKPVIVQDPAQQPFTAFKPDKELNMILAVAFGLLGGIAIAFFLEYLDDTVKTKEELQRITQVPLFGVIPNIQARRGDTTKKDLYAYSQPKSTISEAFRGIRTAISYSSQKQENRVYLVTSSGPKEGKTTIAINVATVMAYSGTRTLIVDADLRKPRVHKSFDMNNAKGLTNVIIGDVRAEDVVQPTSIDNLFVLPSGPIPPNPSELLGRPRMLEILEELRGDYDRILLDTPPIGAVTDAAVLGRIVDSVILVVHAGKTRKKLIERGLEQLGQIDVDVSGIVLNNLKIGRKRYYPGYYHYYYYYSSYYGSDEKGKSKGKGKSKQQA